MSFWNEKNINRAVQILEGKTPLDVARTEGVSSRRISAVALEIFRNAGRRAELNFDIDSISEARTHRDKLIKELRPND